MAEENSIAAGHELRDVNAQAVGCFAILLMLCAIVIFLVIARLHTIFSEQYPSDTPSSRIAVPRTTPPEPRLQSNPSRDMAQFRTREDAALNNYEWVDRQAGIVQIPIERAMEIIVQRGLPANPNSANKTPDSMRQERAEQPKQP